jgi:hypothetical protein
MYCENVIYKEWQLYTFLQFSIFPKRPSLLLRKVEHLLHPSHGHNAHPRDESYYEE